MVNLYQILREEAFNLKKVDRAEYPQLQGPVFVETIDSEYIGNATQYSEEGLNLDPGIKKEEYVVAMNTFLSMYANQNSNLKLLLAMEGQSNKGDQVLKDSLCEFIVEAIDNLPDLKPVLNWKPVEIRPEVITAVYKLEKK